jgi:CRISPR system Cascade subunit CasC
MKHLELHILQSVPVSCLNRDDLNSPKTAIFGGIQRARVSSQSWKRAIRDMAKELYPEGFQGERTRLIMETLKNQLLKEGKNEEESTNGAKEIAGTMNKIDSDTRVKTMFFTTQKELEAMAKEYVATNDAKKAIKAGGGKDLIKDAADIGLFGRMVADGPDLNLEGAAMFSHALSTHKADNEIDFFTAVDDLQKTGDLGAGMMGTLEFNSATYYRFAALNLELLGSESHLGGMTADDRKKVVSTFIKSTLMAMPIARKNSMNGNTLPGYVICVIREKGHPIQLMNAFENPIRPEKGKGVFEISTERLKQEYDSLKNTWDLDEKCVLSIPETKLKDLLIEVEKHVN